MKSICESPETMEAYARIDMGYYIIEEIQRQISSFQFKASPIERMVDEQTGYGKARLNEFRKGAIEAV